MYPNISTFGIANEFKTVFKVKMIPKQLLNDFKTTFKSQKKDLFALIWSKFGQTDHVREARISTKNLDFGGHQKFLKILHESMSLLSPKTMPI